MYCSIRLFLDNTGAVTDTSLAMKILLLLKKEFKLAYKYASFELLDPDKDFSYLINKKSIGTIALICS